MIRILAFTDPHCSLESAKAIVGLARREQPDLILCAGDISYFGMGYEGFLDALAELGREIFFIPGNHDSGSGWESASARYPFLKDISYRTVESAGVRVAGVPGTDTAFWPGLEGGQEAYQLAMDLWEGQDKSKPFVFLCHYPPSGTNLSGAGLPDGGGVRVVRRIIETLQPALVVAGHHHSDFGKEDRIGSSKVVNPGPDGMILTL